MIAGHTDAALFEVALTANGSGAPSDWRAAYDLLERSAKTDLVAAKQVEMLEEMIVELDTVLTIFWYLLPSLPK